MSDYLLDTGPLIYLLRGRQETRQYLDRIRHEGDLSISVLTRAEILHGMKDHERERTLKVLDGIPALVVDIPIADLAGELMRRCQQQGISLELSDAVIAATALYNDLVLVTYNRKDFPMPELRLADIP